MAGCDESLWGSWLGMFVWCVLLVGMHVSGGVVVGRCGAIFQFLIFRDWSFFGICGEFTFPRRDVVSGCLSLRCSDVGWAWVLSFADVCVFVVDVSDPCRYDGCVVVVGSFV